ncbi:HigA family addiction module antitoxin [Paraburkholderia phymatum]|uniref:HigA family addiction module antitoxin n=1 Tax=Paraburkholderia phymatum TaxID=148447 RepID=A0ACC6U5R9_9BURK
MEQIQTGSTGRPGNGMRPIHPGEVLREDFLLPLGMNASTLARALKVSISSVDEVVNEQRPVTAELALRLARYFGGSAESWMNMQQTYDLKVAQHAHGQRIEAEVTPRAPKESTLQ